MSFNTWMVKQTKVYVYSEILFNNQTTIQQWKNQSTDACNNLGT